MIQLDKEHWCYNCKHRYLKSFTLDFGEFGIETSTLDYCGIDETPCDDTYRCRDKEEVEE